MAIYTIYFTPSESQLHPLLKIMLFYLYFINIHPYDN
jgi:Fic family protein